MKRPEFSLVLQKKRPPAPFKVLNMSNQLLRTALVSTLLLAASVRLPAAAARSTQQQIDALRQQQAQAMGKGDFVAAARYGQEVKALEASLAPVAPPALTPTPLVPASSSSFFSAPANAPGPAPAGSSSAFNLPASPGSSFTAPAPALAAPGVSAFTPAPAPAPFTAPAAPVVPSPLASPRAPAPFSPLSAAPLATEEPRPAELPPAVLEMRAAELEAALRAHDIEKSAAAFQKVTATCASCHAVYRNVPQAK